MLIGILTVALAFGCLCLQVHCYRRKFNRQVNQLQQELARTQRLNQIQGFRPIL